MILSKSDEILKAAWGNRSFCRSGSIFASVYRWYPGRALFVAECRNLWIRRFFNPREEIRLISFFAYVDRLSDGSGRYIAGA